MEQLCRLIEANYQSLTGISQAYLSEQRGKLDMILQGYLNRLMALQRYEQHAREPDSPTRSSEEIEALEQELAEPDLPERAAAALEEESRAQAPAAGVARRRSSGTMKALVTELDSMESLLEVLHQNSISLRDPQAISEELDTIVRQSEDSERIVREMESLLSNGTRRAGSDDARARRRRPLATKSPPQTGEPSGRRRRADDDARSTTIPRWARTLAHGIRARLGNTFVLHGNTLDLVPAPKADRSAARGCRLRAAHAVSGRLGVRPARRRHRIPARQRRDLPHPRVAQALHRCRGGRRCGARHRASPRSLPRDPVAFCALLDSFLKQVVHRQPSLGVAVLFPYAETLIPESAGESSAEDRAVRVFIQKWSTDPALLAANVTFVLITENLADISSRVVRSPQTVEIEVERPDEAERLQFLRAVRDAEWFEARSELSVERLAQLTSGLTRIQLRQILSSVDEHGGTARSARRCASRRRRSSKPSATGCSSTSSRGSASTWCRATRASRRGCGARRRRFWPAGCAACRWAT